MPALLNNPLFQAPEGVPPLDVEAVANGTRPPTPRSERTTPRGETPQKQDTNVSRGVTPHGLVTDSAEIK